MVSKVMILMHIVAYLAIIIVNVLANVAYLKDTLKLSEISAMCGYPVYSVCTLIFGVIVN
jgi:hypothetical protein